MGFRIYPYVIDIDYETAYNMDIQNKICFYYDGVMEKGVNYNLRERRVGDYKNTRIIRKNGMAMFFRQTVRNKLWFTVRPEIPYDRPAGQLKILLAWLISKIQGNSDTILMYEKEASRFEESGSVLFEKLVDQGYRNVRYIINKGNSAIDKMSDRCRNQLIYKNTFNHLLQFFRCNKFVGTETMDHSMQLRTANRLVMKKLRDEDLTYIFLQHGVMYMVSLDATARAGFREVKRKKDRIVVSSEAEAMHFIRLGEFKPEDLYVTGLAKFDNSFRYEDADLIMIMPTWRRWEANEALKDFENTGYYRMLMRMVDSVPDEYKDKIVIMPHPLMRQMAEESNTTLNKYFRPDMSHDEVLRHTRMLITDYSSIAYDAFYRGANVVFCWEDMNECMAHYGDAHLMLTEYNAFGDITYNEDQRRKAFEKNYRMEQNPNHVRKYERIVAFRDGKNSERIIEKLKADGVLN